MKFLTGRASLFLSKFLTIPALIAKNQSTLLATKGILCYYFAIEALYVLLLDNQQLLNFTLFWRMFFCLQLIILWVKWFLLTVAIFIGRKFIMNLFKALKFLPCCLIMEEIILLFIHSLTLFLSRDAEILKWKLMVHSTVRLDSTNTNFFILYLLANILRCCSSLHFTIHFKLHFTH